MRIILSGAERSASRARLVEHRVNRMAINVTQLSVPKSKPFDIDQFGGAELTVYTSEKDEDVAKYDEFLRNHHEHLQIVVGRPDYDGDWLREKYYPVWRDASDVERLAHLMERFGRVAISDKALNKTTLKRIAQLQLRWKPTIVLLSSKPDMIEALDWDYVIVSSWTSVMRYGETQIWDGRKMYRYPAQNKESGRAKNRAAIERLGCDFDKVMEDDQDEVVKLAIRSWVQWEMDAWHSAYDPSVGEVSEGSTPTEGEADSSYLPHTHGGYSEDRTPPSSAITLPEKRHEGDKKLLPLMGLEKVSSSPTVHGSGPDESTDVDPTPVNVVQRSAGNLRSCDSCYLNVRCPESRSGSECAYEFPVELRTRDQYIRMLNFIMEMQFERTMFAAFAEQLEGQGVDVAVSKEMDRLFNMVEKFKSISDTRDVLSFKVEARAKAGVIESIFGASTKNKMNELPTPVDSNHVVQQLGIPTDTDIVEGEVVE